MHALDMDAGLDMRQLPCLSALAAAASATHGASTAACAFLLLAFMSNKVGERGSVGL